MFYNSPPACSAAPVLSAGHIASCVDILALGVQGMTVEDTRQAADDEYEAAMEHRRQEVEAERHAAEAAQVCL